jgi:hydroxymethylpyrimidine/phosphomethylpyrimidine kinase
MSGPEDPPVALSIAGSDSGAGAGIQADLKTMAALGVFATTVVTAVTAQNTTAVRAVHLLPVPMIEAQIAAVFEDFRVASVKTGMLGTASVVEAVGRRAAHGDLPRLVVDPVMVASTGRIFLDDQGVDAYRLHLLPHTLVTTPNLWEAGLLAGVDPGSLRDIEAMGEVARRIHDLGPAYVLVKGGHLPGVEPHDVGAAPEQVADVLFDGSHVTVLTGTRVDTANTHGTGCSLSSAITAHLARGADVPTAVREAKEFVHRALVGGAEWQLGKGHGPLDHHGWSRRSRDE